MWICYLNVVVCVYVYVFIKMKWIECLRSASFKMIFTVLSHCQIFISFVLSLCLYLSLCMFNLCWLSWLVVNSVIVIVVLCLFLSLVFFFFFKTKSMHYSFYKFKCGKWCMKIWIECFSVLRWIFMLI